MTELLQTAFITGFTFGLGFFAPHIAFNIIRQAFKPLTYSEHNCSTCLRDD